MAEILDPCCGSKMFYYDKDNAAVMFGDIRELHTKLCDGRELHIQPDKLMDVTDMKEIENDTFSCIIFDPPHLVQVGESSWLAQKYGHLPLLWEEKKIFRIMQSYVAHACTSLLLAIRQVRRAGHFSVNIKGGRAMNEPIISPWLIYWIGRLGLVQAISCVLGILLTAGTSAFMLEKLTDDFKKDEPFSKLFKALVCIALFFDVLAIFVPTKSEIIAMYTAKNITPANIKATGEFADKAVDKLIEKILKASEAAREK